MTRGPNGGRSGERRKEILGAALHVIVESGDSGTFIQEVRDRAGVSVGTLYHHFGSKDRLIATLHYTVLNEYQSGAGALLAPDPPAEEGIRGTVAYHLRWLVRHPREATFLLQHPFAGYRSSEVPAELLEEYGAFLATVRRWLDSKMAAGEMRTIPFDLVVATLIGPVHHWARSALYHGSPSAASLRQAVAELGDGAWQALRPVGPRSPLPSGTPRTR